MKARSAAVQGTLAAVALAAAWSTWQRPKDSGQPDAVKVLAATRQSLDKVRFEDGPRFVELARHAEPEPRLWVTMGFLPGQAPTGFDAGFSLETLDAGADGGTITVSSTPAPPTPTREMLANERGDGVFTRFEPLEGTRALGHDLPASKLEELGLTDSKRLLEVTIAGQVHRFVVSRPVPGIIGAYLQDQQSHDVFLIQSSLLNDLDPTSQVLVDRRLHAFKQSEFDAFTLTVGADSAAFVQTNAEIAQTAKVARKASPETPDDAARNWHDKIWNRLVVTEVLGKGESPKTGEPRVGLHLEYSLRGAKKGFLDIGFDSTSGTWARSENTASWVAIHQGSDELVLEAQKLLKP